MALNKTVRNAITDSAINTDKIADGTLIADDFASSTIGVAKTSIGVNEPTISSFTPSTLTVTSGGAITINGAGFISIPTVRFINQSTGAVVEASAVSFTSVTQISATMPASQTEGTYKFVVENSNGLSVQSSTAITYSDGPTWTTSAGSLGSFQEGDAVSVTVAATDGSETIDTFAITSGSLPGGLSLNTSTGVISGTASEVGSDTTSNFTIRATDDEGQTADRAFTITITDFSITNSLRMDKAAADNLERTYGTPTNSKKFALSWWVKLSEDPTVGAAGHDLWGERTNSSNRVFMAFNGTGQFDYFEKNGGSNVLELKTNRIFRDVGAWYHFLLLGDSTQSTASNRIKLYVNGVQETSFATETYPSQDYDFRLALNTTKYYGRIGLGSQLSTNYMRGYLAEAVFIDGTVYTQANFGEVDSDTGEWVPISVSGLTFGNNGFHLNFTNSGALGTDASSNTNNFTLNNITSADQSIDTPLNSYSILNSLLDVNAHPTYSLGGLKFAGTGATNFAGASIPVSNGKWYVEVKATTTSGSYPIIGVIDAQSNMRRDSTYFVGTDASTENPSGFAVFTNSDIYHNGDNNFGDLTTTYTSGDIIGMALDMDASPNTLGFYKNGTLEATINLDTAPSGAYMFCAGIHSSTSGAVGEFNFGNPTFTISSANADANGYGSFEYTVPSGYFALNTKNLAQYG